MRDAIEVFLRWYERREWMEMKGACKLLGRVLVWGGLKKFCRGTPLSGMPKRTVSSV